ncbi:hypothetical protein MANY_04250 [Mycolicibacterium anyangense]|uniref:Uncharacterized protein n=1 Tax=Mycolicibacterium anyangense TaxID=1431246 RepID=A0A6N4W3F0_9MYCO|nr:hypothetical protein MANY_04250 [Mycolicibacterium anyangense]
MAQVPVRKIAESPARNQTGAIPSVLTSTSPSMMWTVSSHPKYQRKRPAVQSQTKLPASPSVSLDHQVHRICGSPSMTQSGLMVSGARSTGAPGRTSMGRWVM